MKTRIVNGILSLTILAQSFAASANAYSYFPPGTPQDRQSFFDGVDRMAARSPKTVAFANLKPEEVRRRIAEGTKAAALAPLKSVGHMSQTLMLLWILGGVEALRQQHKMAPFQTGKPISNVQLALEVGDQMVNSFDLMASFLGGSTASVAMKMPLDALNQLVASKVTQPMLRQLLNAGAGSFVTFVGWEAGAKLWEQSMLQLPVDDIKIAKELRFTEIMTGRGTPEQKRVFGQMLSSAYGILTWAEPETTGLWLYNTWRHRIATGEFVTLVTSMVTAGVVAGSLAPGAGTVVGFCFGLAGGLVGGFAAMYMPHSYKQPITDGYRRASMNSGRNRLAKLDYGLRLILRGSGFSQAVLATQVPRTMQSRSQSRDRIMTTEFEQIYDAFLRRQEAEGMLQIVMQHNPILQSTADEMMDMRDDAQAQLLEANDRLRFYLDESLKLYLDEAMSAGELAYAPGTSPEVQAALLMEVSKLTRLFALLRQVYSGLLPEDIEKLEVDAPTEEERMKLQVSAQIFLNLVYMRGFTEAEFLNL